ncbi:MAG: hypothetical protein WAQ25_04825 [Candidatus Saccharimonas sp.]
MTTQDHPSQPPAPPQQPQVPTYAQPAVATQINAPSDTLGIISIVLCVLGMAIPGIICGIIGENKAKQAGISPTLSRIGWILNLISIIFTVIGISIIIIIALIGSTGS